ncbi:MAG: DNA ligase, partial [Telluria sp.]
SQADKSDLAEGLYIKVEQDGVVEARYKWVRSDFVQAILDANVHHSQQPFVPNQLACGVDIYAPYLSTTWEDLGLMTRPEGEIK